MGRGGGICSKVGGRENPAIAAWAVSATLMAATSMTLFLLAEATQLTDTAGKGLNPEEYGEVMFVSRATFLGLGGLHAVLFICSCIITILGYFFWSQLLCFACPLVILNQIACIVTSAFGGYMLHCVYNHRTEQIDIARLGGISPSIDFSVSFVDSHASLILFISISSLCSLSPLSRAGTIDEKGTMVDIMLHLPTITGCICMSGLFIFPSREKFYIIMGSFWLILSILACILIFLQKYNSFISRIATFIFSFYYIFVFIFSILSIVICGKHYIGGRNQVIDYVRTAAIYKPQYLKNMNDDDYYLYKNYIIQNEGGFSLAAILLSSLLFIYSFMGALFSLRALIGGSDALRRDISGSSSDKD